MADLQRKAFDAFTAKLLEQIEGMIDARVRKVLNGDYVQGGAITGTIPADTLPPIIQENLDEHRLATPIDHPAGSIDPVHLSFTVPESLDDLADVSPYGGGDAGKVLTVNGTEDGAEWTTVAGGVTAFTDLDDVDPVYAGHAGDVVVVNGAEDGLEYATPAVSIDTLLELTDFPDNYTGQAGKQVVVNGTEDGVIFQTIVTGSTVTVKESDGSPIYTNIDTISFAGGVVTNPSSGVALFTPDTAGAPATGAYVFGATAVPGGITGGIAIPWFAYHPDIIPASPDAVDDEFEGASLDGKWGWYNQGSNAATLGDNSHLRIDTPASQTAAMLKQTISGSSYRVGVKINWMFDYHTNVLAGISLRENATTKIFNWGFYHAAELRIGANIWTGSTYNGMIYESVGPYTSGYFALDYAWPNVTFQYSIDGINYLDHGTYDLSAHFTTAADEVGYFTANGNTYPVVISSDWFRKLV